MESGEKRARGGSPKPSKKGGKVTKTMTAEEEAKKREEIKERLREKLELEKRALKVVERLLDDAVTEDFLVDCAQFITPANYKDAVEERSITLLCGYPVCSNQLGKIPTQQYMISTKTNKVYDITERKCFCSNFCYKASKEFALQISKTPLWLRQHEGPEEIKLLKKGSSGSSGEEVLLKESRLGKADIENPLSAQCEEPQLSKDGLSTSDGSEDEPEQEFVSSVIPHRKHRVHWDELPKRTDEGVEKERRTLKSTEEPERDDGGERQIRETEESKEAAETNDTGRPPVRSCSAEKESSVEEVTQQTRACTLSDMDTRSSPPPVRSAAAPPELASAPPTQNTPVFPSVPSRGPPRQPDLHITQVSVSRRGAAGLRELLQKHTVQPKAASVQDNLLQHLRATLQEWCTAETIAFLHGTAQPPSSTTQRRAEEEGEEEELDEDDLDTVVMSDKATETQRTNAVAPEYETLQREAQQLQRRVREFYNGTRILPEDEAGNKESQPDRRDRDPSLPLPDSQAQHLIQKRIVVDRLCSCLRNVVGPLQLTMSDISPPLNNLVRTFRLTNVNIIHRSPEWTLIGVLLLHVLSGVSPVVREALAASSSVLYLKTLMDELGLQQQHLLSLVRCFQPPTQ